MINSDKKHHHERITALHEARQKTVTSRSLELYWEALSNVGKDDFDAAIVRATQSGAIAPHELRRLAEDAKRERISRFAKPPNTFRCHAHEEHPDLPSPKPTMHWCDRCSFFVSEKRQEPDRDATPGPTDNEQETQ